MMTPATSHVVAGKYRLDRPLARGGMGSVWVARHLQLDSVVAIKFMEGDQLASGAENRARFEREARMAAQLQSPNIVQVHDYGVEDGTPYMVMELLQGEDLRARLRRDRVLTLREVTHIVQQLSRALRKAHELGIVHRDLKPANVFLAKSDGEELVKILDFGIAKAAAGKAVDDATQTGVILGSLRYMSPEQARGFRTLDHRSDLWSLGVIVFRALTGRLPFDGEQSGDVLVKICAEPIPSASAFKPSLGPGIDAFFERAFAREPAARFQNAGEMAAALATLLEGGDGRASAVSLPASSELPPTSDGTGTPNSVRGGVTTSRTGDTNGWTPIPGMKSGGRPLLEPSAPPPRGLHQRSGVLAAGVMLLVAVAASITLALLHTPAPDELTGGGAAVAVPAVAPSPTTRPATSSPAASSEAASVRAAPTATATATATASTAAAAATTAVTATTPPAATPATLPATTTPAAKASVRPPKPGKPSSELGF